MRYSRWRGDAWAPRFMPFDGGSAPDEVAIRSKGMVLVDLKTGKPARPGQEVLLQGEAMILEGGTAPLNETVTGRIYLKDSHGFKRERPPETCNLVWRRDR